LQGMSTASLIQLDDKEEHARLRAHLNAFFTQENVDAVYTTLRDGVVDRINKLAMREVPSMEGKESGAQAVQVDAFDFAFDLLNEVVMKVR
jgi:cytochrome P450